MTVSIEPVTPSHESSVNPQKSPIKESIAHKHFDYTLVFGQGPVQEKFSVPEAGRKGLNLYSRLNALAAAEMLENGITDKLILSGGKTGARAELDEGKSEAELMLDVIRRHITHLSDDNKSFTVLGKRVELLNSLGEKKSQSEIDIEINEVLQDKILIENQSKDTLANFTYVINKYLDQPKASESQVALLGIDFHTGRLNILADIFGLGGDVYSAENIIKELVVNRRPEGSSVRNQLQRIADLSLSHEVTQLKSQQEEILMRGLRGGDWLRVAKLLENPNRLRQALLHDSYVTDQLALVGISKEQITTLEPVQLLDALDKVKRTGLESYAEVKKKVFDRLQEMTNATGIDYYGLYAKGELPKV